MLVLILIDAVLVLTLVAEHWRVERPHRDAVALPLARKGRRKLQPPATHRRGSLLREGARDHVRERRN